MNHLNGKNEEDRRIYERSARLILLLALRDIAPGAKARFEHSIGLGLYLNVSGVSLTASLVRKIEARMREISKADLPIVKSRWTREQAVAYFRAQGQEDTVRLLHYRYLGRETKKIRNMGRFRTLKFNCQLGSSQGFSFTDGSVFTIWISDDENKIPLYIESPVRVGSINAYISGYKGLKYPMTSLVK